MSKIWHVFGIYQVKLILIASFLLGSFSMSSGAAVIDIINSIFDNLIFKFLFGVYVFSGCLMVLLANAYLVFSGYGLVPTRGSLEKAPAVVQVSYRYFYRPMVVGLAFLLGGALGSALL